MRINSKLSKKRKNTARLPVYFEYRWSILLSMYYNNKTELKEKKTEKLYTYITKMENTPFKKQRTIFPSYLDGKNEN